ncbi:hypothetical protein G3O08_17455 [Cryomorpha ignava]|uniref:Lipoprotein n=1 Tax=Cryomorpha ignava TaxID=101383 RepID=A0A7K3WUD9_9FLAO|nr:hypothetical protein [Cryomorpha ignava]NEN25287.1 hypothetical protein [Cryomorpha ignava]
MIFKTLRMFLLAVLASSCTFIVFNEPMPTGATPLDRVPESLRGNYIYEIESMTSKVEIGENYFISDSLPEYLSDSLILKPFGEKYVLSKKIIDPKIEADGKWLCYILSPAKGGNLNVEVFCVADTTYEEKLIAKYGGKQMKAPKELGEPFLFLDTDLKQFKKLSKDKKVRIPVVLRPVE